MQAAGKRDQRITLERRTVSAANEYGEQTETWAVLATVWAEAHPTRGKEFFGAGQQQARADVMFRLLHRDVSEEDRVVWNGDRYELVAPPVDVSGAREVVELYCARIVRDGR